MAMVDKMFNCQIEKEEKFKRKLCEKFNFMKGNS